MIILFKGYLPKDHKRSLLCSSSSINMSSSILRLPYSPKSSAIAINSLYKFIAISSHFKSCSNISFESSDVSLFSTSILGVAHKSHIMSATFIA